jgi:uncharacterized protein YktA (UPF0223 family)
VWEELKKNKTITLAILSTNKNKYKTIVKAVRKEKWMDKQFRTDPSHTYYKVILTYSMDFGSNKLTLKLEYKFDMSRYGYIL